MIYQSEHKGLASVILESAALRVTILPELGSKLVSIEDKASGEELFYQRKTECLVLPEAGDLFLNYDASGFDEMFPTIDACPYPAPGKFHGITLPDHGEVWYLPWEVQLTNHQVFLKIAGKILPYVLEKNVSFKNSRTLRIDYRLKNVSDLELAYLWAMHGLINCHPTMELILPLDVQRVVNVFSSDVLGEPGKVHSYPITKDLSAKEYRLDRVQPPSAKKIEKWYVSGEMSSGRVGVYYPHSQQLYQLSYPVDKIPYLGFYVTEGGGGVAADYNCALEPSTGFYDTLERAHENQKVSILPAHGQITWFLEIYWGPKY